MQEIAKLVREEIHQAGVISLARFMELALYCPKIGYYECPERIIGRSGDYFTSVSTGPLFGELLAFQFMAWIKPAGPIQWVEAGAHDGQLAFDVLSWLSQNHAEWLERVEYWIIEPSVTRQKWQRTRLDKFAGRVRWAESFRSFPREGINGVIFSNELLDSFPAHQLRWDAGLGAWCEWGVTLKNERLVWQKMGASDWSGVLEAAGLHYPPELMAVVPDGFTVEISPAAGRWWGEAAQLLRKGKLLTLDYGWTAEEMMQPEHAQGTFRGYWQQHLAMDPLANPGEQDLTCHINFTQLERAGEAAGLSTESLLPQGRFLTGIARKMWSDGAPQPPWTPERIRQFQSLQHPAWLGGAFRVLIQSR